MPAESSPVVRRAARIGSGNDIVSMSTLGGVAGPIAGCAHLAFVEGV